jgi:hypothetical protein
MGRETSSTKDLVQKKRKRRCTMFLLFYGRCFKNLKPVWERVNDKWNRNKMSNRKKEAEEMNRYHTVDRDIGD